MSAEFVELGVMGQWCHRLEDHSQRRSWWIDGRKERENDQRWGRQREASALSNVLV